MVTLERKLNINSKYFFKLLECLRSSGAQARLVGGVVRDALLHLPSADIDIVTDLEPNQVIDLLSSKNIKVIPTGIKHGTVTSIIEDEAFEITTLRKDISCDGRFATVEYSDDFAEDAARRDFTINALSYCPITNIIYDYFSGIEDLKAGRVVFIGNPAARISEDYLRILRFFRFSCCYAKEIDKEGLRACTQAKNNLSKLSKERIKSEMDALLLQDKSPKILAIMFDTSILQHVLPIVKYEYEMHSNFYILKDSFHQKIDLSILYALLLKNSVEINFNQLLNLKFSKVEARSIIKMLSLVDFDKLSITNRLRNIWLEDRDYVRYFIFAEIIITDNKFIRQLYNRLSKRSVPDFPVNGNDLIELGYKGKNIGNIINMLKQIWVDSDFSLDRPTLINMVKNSEK